MSIPEYIQEDPILLDLYLHHKHQYREYSFVHYYDTSKITINDKRKWDILETINEFIYVYLTMLDELIKVYYTPVGTFYISLGKYTPSPTDIDDRSYRYREIWKKRINNLFRRYSIDDHTRLQSYTEYTMSKENLFDPVLLTDKDIVSKIRQDMRKRYSGRFSIPKNRESLTSLMNLERRIAEVHGSYIFFRTDINLRKSYLVDAEGNDISSPENFKEEIVKKIQNNMRFNPKIKEMVLDYTWTIEIGRPDDEDLNERRWHMHIGWFIKDDLDEDEVLRDYPDMENQDKFDYNRNRYLYVANRANRKQREKMLIMKKGNKILDYLTNFISPKKYHCRCVYNQDGVTVVKKDNINDRNLIYLWLTYLSKEYYNTKEYRKKNSKKCLYGTSSFTKKPDSLGVA